MKIELSRFANNNFVLQSQLSADEPNWRVFAQLLGS